MAGETNIYEMVIDVLEGRTGGAEADRVLSLVAAEPEWHEAHRFLAQFLDTSRISTLQPVPSSTRAMLERLLPQRRHAIVDEVKGAVSSIGRLVRDLPSGAAFAGARGAIGTTRQLLFALDADRELVVELATLVDPIRISGQLLGTSGSYSVVFVSDTETLELAADELGEFEVQISSPTFLRLDIVTADHRATLDLTPFLDDEG